ncbi:MAG: acyl carrier protein [Gemmatimonadota bacterium]|nr:acyl carrier protein [Gemmatimonadota bacterium]
MSDIQERLVNCFSAVFPALSRDEILRASDSSVPNWDSLTMVTLVTVIEEEFGITIMPEDYEYLNSFETVLQLLQRKSVGTGG